MTRIFTVVFFFLCASISSADDIQVVVDDDDHFVILSDSIELLGFQLESPSGSLIPSETSDPSPFHFWLVNEPTVVGLGSLGDVVTVVGSLKLSTRWDSSGQKDVGFQWGNYEADGWAAVDGHDFTFVEPESIPVTPAVEIELPPSPSLPQSSGDVNAFVALDIDANEPAATLLPEPTGFELLFGLLLLLPAIRTRNGR